MIGELIGKIIIVLGFPLSFFLCGWIWGLEGMFAGIPLSFVILFLGLFLTRDDAD